MHPRHHTPQTATMLNWVLLRHRICADDLPPLPPPVKLISSLQLMHNASSEALLLQVVMDILGCLVTCLTCNLLLHQLAGMLPIS